MTLHVLTVGKSLKDMTSQKKNFEILPNKRHTSHYLILLCFLIFKYFACYSATVHSFYIPLQFVTHVASALTRSHHLASLYKMLLKF